MSAYRRIGWAALIAAPFVGLLGFGMTRNPNAIPSTLPGKESPKFVLPVFSTGEVANVPDSLRLDSASRGVTVINFFASWCLACRDEHHDLSETARFYAGRDTSVRFIGMLYNDSPPNALQWIREQGGQFYPAVQDPGSRTAIAYGLWGVPETFIIGPDGKVAYKHVGPITSAVLRRHIDSLLPRSTP
jgi:cytochrome c biogenesis protein CcmG/thiol:disulfide interchange protein DsbE